MVLIYVCFTHMKIESRGNLYFLILWMYFKSQYWSNEESDETIQTLFLQKNITLFGRSSSFWDINDIYFIYYYYYYYFFFYIKRFGNRTECFSIACKLHKLTYWSFEKFLSSTWENIY